MNKKIEQWIAVILVIIVFGWIFLQAVSVEGTKAFSTKDNGDVLNTPLADNILSPIGQVVHQDTKEAEAFYEHLDELSDKAKAERE